MSTEADERYQAKLLARANGETPLTVKPADEPHESAYLSAADARYHRKLAARKAGTVTPIAVPAASETAPPSEEMRAEKPADRSNKGR